MLFVVRTLKLCSNLLTSGEKSSDIMSQGIGPKPIITQIKNIKSLMFVFTDGEHGDKEREGHHREHRELGGERRVMSCVRDIEIHSCKEEGK